jgi:peptidyl-tRNA hydrolase
MIACCASHDFPSPVTTLTRRRWERRNRSGAAVAELMKKYGVPLERVVVVHDDMDTPIASLKLKKVVGS